MALPRRRRPWTAEEDEAIRAAAANTFNEGLTVLDDAGDVGRAGRLADLARRIGAFSYPMYRSGRRG